MNGAIIWASGRHLTPAQMHDAEMWWAISTVLYVAAMALYGYWAWRSTR